MTAGRPVFRILRNVSDPAADAALLAALEGADEGTARAVVETLLARRSRPGLLGLLAKVHLLDGPLRDLLGKHMDVLFSALRDAALSRNDQTQVNALEMIRCGRAYRACYLLDAAFHAGAPRVRETAAKTLYGLAEAILQAAPEPPDPAAAARLSPEDVQARMVQLEAYAEDRRQFVSAVESGLAQYEVHRFNRVVEVAMWFIDDMGSRFWTIAGAPGSRVAQAAVRILGQGLTPRLVPFAMAALNYSQFRPQAAAVFGRCTDAAILKEWIGQSWRLSQPRAARAMAAVRQLACLDRRAENLLALPPEAKRLVGRWVMAMGLSGESKADALLHLLHRGDLAGRRAAVWAAVQWPDEPATHMLRDLAGDPDAEISRMARFELARRRPQEIPPSRLMARETGDPAPRPGAAPGITFDRYWAGFDRFSEEERSRLGEELLAWVPDVPAELARRLGQPLPAMRVRALAIIRALSLGEALAEPLHRLSHDPHPEVRSAVMSVLAQVPGGTTRRILRSALYDQDPRVRANAIEAAEQAGDEDIEDLLLPMLGSAHGRVRANAVKALLKQGVQPAAETLIRMLQDPDRAQRISALWLVERMGLAQLTARISRMAAGDQDTQVQLRARRIVEGLSRPAAASTATPALTTAGEVASP